jgi:hypothetical protein
MILIAGRLHNPAPRGGGGEVRKERARRMRATASYDTYKISSWLHSALLSNAPSEPGAADFVIVMVTVVVVS